MANCDNLHLLIYDWSNMALIHVLHPHVVLFLLLVSFIFFGMYFLRGIYTIYTLPYTVLATKILPRKLSISYNFVALVLWFGVYYYVSLLKYHWFWQIMSLIYLGYVLHNGDFLSNNVTDWLFFSKDILVMSLWGNGCFNPMKIWL